MILSRLKLIHGPSGPDPTSQFEHSSIPATVKKLFNLNNFLTKRDAWAGTFEGLLTRKTPRTDCPVTLSEPVKLRERGAIEKQPLSDFQKELVQMAACLSGDHRKETYPDKLVENMNVAGAVEYVGKAFELFIDEGEKARKGRGGWRDSNCRRRIGRQGRGCNRKKDGKDQVLCSEVLPLLGMQHPN